jgi:hypothetical protein
VRMRSVSYFSIYRRAAARPPSFLSLPRRHHATAGLSGRARKVRNLPCGKYVDRSASSPPTFAHGDEEPRPGPPSLPAFRALASLPAKPRGHTALTIGRGQEKIEASAHIISI